MEAATTAFMVTVAIIGGILSPIVVIYLLGVMGNFVKAMGLSLEGWVEDVKKRPPFEDVEVNIDPGTNVMTVRFVKDGKVVYQGASSRNRMEVDNVLEFERQEVKDDGR